MGKTVKWDHGCFEVKESDCARSESESENESKSESTLNEALLTAPHF